MGEPEQGRGASGDVMFGSAGGPAEKTSLPLAVWVVAALVLIAVAAGLAVAGRGKPAPVANTLLPIAAYGQSLALTQMAMSESTSLSGGKVTYLDGHVANKGDRTLTGMTVQVVFANDEALPPQIITLPVTLIRTREPYVDTEPVSAEPLKPGDDREFRLIFEAIPSNWNTQLPEVRVVGTVLR